jgi:RNA polymerase sigma-70 factor (ECF subfamily)
MPDPPRTQDFPASGGTGVDPANPARDVEEDLVNRIRRGEPELFYELVRPYERRVYVIAFTIVRSEADAEDIVQEALLKAFMHLAQYRSEARFSTWLIQIAINEARMKLRKNHPETMRPLEDHESEDGTYTPSNFMDWREIPSEALERKEVREKLIAALGSLARKYREVFVLRDVQNLSTEETANALGISAGLVKTRLLRARLMLRDLLAAGFDSLYGGPSRLPKGLKPWT